MNRAIIYFSLTNNTEQAAQKIANEIGADLIKIETVRKLPSTMFFQMMVCGCQATFGMCPKIKGMPEDIDKYDEIIIGTPIWAGVCVPAFNTLFKKKNLRGKIVGAFTYSGGGDNDKCIENLEKKLGKLRYSVALADRKNPLSSSNDEKLSEFIEEIVRG